MFPLAEVLRVVDEDRASLERFRTTAAARPIAEYLDVLATDLATVEQTARDLAAHAGPSHTRPYPRHLGAAGTYERAAMKAAF